MSISLEKLRALKREAGAPAPSLCAARGGMGSGAVGAEFVEDQRTSNSKINSTPPQSSPALRAREEARGNYSAFGTIASVVIDSFTSSLTMGTYRPTPKSLRLIVALARKPTFSLPPICGGVLPAP